MAPLTYWVWLSALAGVGTAAKNRLLHAFGSPEQIFFADERAYHDADIALGQAEKAALMDKSLAEARRILDVCAEHGYRILTITDAEYPARLKNIDDPPVVLYVRGALPVIDEEACVAIVGTRSCTPYGLKTAERLRYEATRNGLLIVTGLARGIDTASALGALRAGGRVVGVLGSGVDVVYPKENAELFEDVAAVGALVSEYPPGTPALSGNFPRRNRIISGLSCGVVVVEAPPRSGALITAALALERGGTCRRARQRRLRREPRDEPAHPRRGGSRHKRGRDRRRIRRSFSGENPYEGHQSAARRGANGGSPSAPSCRIDKKRKK